MLGTGHRSIDLNCDLGEGVGDDEAIMPMISSANIACGEHAGDEETIRKTILLALGQGVAIGAHPSYPDRLHFGRIDLLDQEAVTLDELAVAIQVQLLRFSRICQTLGARIHHVKLHGALYNRASDDPLVAGLFCRIVQEFDPSRSILIYGLSGSLMSDMAARHEIRFVHEVFADRTYGADGRLTPRKTPNALIDDPAISVQQVLSMIREGRVMTTAGTSLSLLADTICIHGDGLHALDHVKAIRKALEAGQIRIGAPSAA